MLPSPETVDTLVNGLLNREYADTVSPVLGAIGRGLSSGVVALRLRQFQDEVNRLSDAGLPLTIDNPVLAALMNDVRDVLRSHRALMSNAAPDLQNSAVNAAATLTPQLAVGPAARWTIFEPETVNRLVQLVDTPAWEMELDSYETGITQRFLDVVIRGLVKGQNPRTTARELTNMIDGLPRSTAEMMMKSLQLTGYRRATTAMQVANADIIAYVVRIAVLDTRTCLSCIALHGTRLEVGQEVEDHRRGRCTSVSVLKGATGTPSQIYYVDDQPVEVRTGLDWLRAHTAAGQRDIMGNANYNAYVAGAVQLSDFVQRYDDPLFGDVFTEASLKGLLGERAKEYYRR